MTQEPKIVGHLVNLDRLARVLGMSLPKARSLVRDCPDLPVVSRGRQGKAWVFNLDEVLAWRDRTQVVAAEKTGQISPAQEKARWEAERTKDQVRLSRGELVEARVLHVLLAEIFTSLRKRVLMVPLDLKRRFNLSREIHAESVKMLTGVLNETAEALRDPASQAAMLRRGAAWIVDEEVKSKLLADAQSIDPEYSDNE